MAVLNPFKKFVALRVGAYATTGWRLPLLRRAPFPGVFSARG
jgi:hypothetical protein